MYRQWTCQCTTNLHPLALLASTNRRTKHVHSCLCRCQCTRQIVHNVWRKNLPTNKINYDNLWLTTTFKLSYKASCLLWLKEVASYFYDHIPAYLTLCLTVHSTSCRRCELEEPTNICMIQLLSAMSTATKASAYQSQFCSVQSKLPKL